MKMRSDRPQFFIFFIGAAALTALSISRLPPFGELLRAPSTPFDRSAAAGAAPDFRLFWQAATVIPAGVSVSPLSQPRDPVRETTLHREAVALLPGRRVLPAATWNVPTRFEEQADFLIVAGPRPPSSPGALVLETAQGSVWRRTPR